jgi:hypothetical protein
MKKGDKVKVLNVEDGRRTGIKVGMVVKVVLAEGDGYVLIEHPDIIGHTGNSDKKGHKWWMSPGNLELVKPKAKKKKGKK